MRAIEIQSRPAPAMTLTWLTQPLRNRPLNVARFNVAKMYACRARLHLWAACSAIRV